MTARIRHLVRLVTDLTLLALSVEAMRGEGLMRLLGLLAVLAIAFTHHAPGGQFPSLLFASLVVTLELAHERP